MSDFSLYLKLGFNHITDLTAYDHILFLVALCAIYQLKHWKSIFILVTAFTLGHSLSLMLAVFNIVNIRTDIVEFLIPVTIILTCLFNIYQKEEELVGNSMKIKYGLASFFGLIHGLGFSNYLKQTFSLLLKEEFSIFQPLLAFNVGLELGQLVIVLFILGTTFIFLNGLKTKQREWNLFISGLCSGISLILLMETKFW